MRAVICAVLSFFVPGLGSGFVGRYRSMAMWVVVASAASAACALSIWFVPMIFAVRIAAMTGAFRDVRAADRAGTPADWLGALLALGFQVGLVVVIKGLVIEGFAASSSSMAPTLVIDDHVLVEKLSPRVRGVARGDVIVFEHPCTPRATYLKRVIALAGEAVEIRCNVVHINGAPLAASLVQGEGCTYTDREDVGAVRTQPCSEYVETAGAHTYRVYHEAERPARDASPQRGADARDFPPLQVPPVAPSCATDQAGDGTEATNQAPGTIVEARTAAAPCERQRHYVVPAGHVFVLGDNRANSNDSRWWGAVPVENIRGRVNGIWVTRGPSGTSLARFGGID